MKDGAKPQKPPPPTSTPSEENQPQARGEKHEANKRVREKTALTGSQNVPTMNRTG